MIAAFFSRGVRALTRLAGRRASAAPAYPDVLAALGRMERQAHPPAVIVPIHNAPAEVADCLDALVRHTPGSRRIILIDDASTDRAIDAILARYATAEAVEIHRNEGNLGFTRTVNRGLEIAGRSDAVLLNSDTKVTPRWLDNLKLAAYSGDRIGTATPFSNNAGAFSAPQPDRDNPLPRWLELDAYARLVMRVSRRLYPRVPTGSGFCIYLRRDCLDAVGLLDAEAFPRGYGEENDFCMRALRQGWEHVIDDATLIFHKRSASFGEAKIALIKQGRAVLDARYPDYSTRVRAFARDRQLNGARKRIGSALARSEQLADTPKPPVLSIYRRSRAGEASGVDHDAKRRLAVRLVDGQLDLFESGPGGSEFLQRPFATFRADTAGSTPVMAQIEAVMASWLVSHAVEAAAIADGSPLGAMLQRLCTRLNIPNDPSSPAAIRASR